MAHFTGLILAERQLMSKCRGLVHTLTALMAILTPRDLKPLILSTAPLNRRIQLMSALGHKQTFFMPTQNVRFRGESGH